MSELPKMKRLQKKRPITVKVEPDVDDIYRTGRQNGWNVPEIARRAVSAELRKIASDLKKPAS